MVQRYSYGDELREGKGLFDNKNIEVVVSGKPTDYFDTFDEVYAYLQTLTTLSPEAVTVTFAPGTYTYSGGFNGIALGYPVIMYGNSSTLQLGADSSVYIGSSVHNMTLEVTGGVYASARCFYEYCTITASGGLSIAGAVRLSFCEVNADISYTAADKSLVAARCYLNGIINASGECQLAECYISVNSASPAVTSTGGILWIFNTVIVNTGGGGDVSCDNGATISAPNVIDGITCGSGTITAGTAVTILGANATASAVSGSAISNMGVGKTTGTEVSYLSGVTSAIQAQINGKEDTIGYTTENVANKSTDILTDAASNTKYPGVKAIKDYADGLVVGLLDYRGAYDASVNTFPAAGGSGTAGAILKGDMWIISVAGTLGGTAVQIGDSVIASVDTPAQTASNWNILNANISYVPEDAANKETSALDTSTTKYPCNNVVKDAVDAKQDALGYTPVPNTRTVNGYDLSSDVTVSKSDVGLGNVANILDKLDATTAPTVNNDVDEGYSVGSKWCDVTADKAYICLDATDGAAVWTEITQSGGDLPVTALGTSGAVTLDGSVSDRFTIKPTGAVTLSLTNMAELKDKYLAIEDGNSNVSFPSDLLWQTDLPNQAPRGMDLVKFTNAPFDSSDKIFARLDGAKIIFIPIIVAQFGYTGSDISSGGTIPNQSGATGDLVMDAGVYLDSNGIHFDGTGKNAQAVNFPAFGTGDYTMNIWANMASFPQYATFTDFSTSRYSLGVKASGPSLNPYPDTGGIVSLSGLLSTSEWHMYTWVREDGVLYEYFDASLVKTTASTTTIAGGTLTLGSLSGSNEALNGLLDTVTICSNSWTQDYITDQFNAGR